MRRRTRLAVGMTVWASIRSWTRAAIAAAVVLVAFALAPASAQGHAAFQDASPEPGARLAAAPSQVTLAFTEPLNHQLTTARIVNARTGRRLAASLSFGAGDHLVLRPLRALPTGAFRVAWHTVSIRDGHALEGSFGFGVRTTAVGGAQQLEQSPLARDGWLRVALRAVWYAALFFFGGGLLTAVILRSPAGPAGWLLPRDDVARPCGEDRDAALRRIWRRTRAAGWIAAAAGIAVALADTQDAAGGLSWHAVDAYLLSTASGGARAIAVASVAVAAVLAARAWRVATAALLVALGAIAFGGHANSASPRALALLSDWLHLVAATAWAGGIAQIVATWLPGIGRLPFGERRMVIRAVLDRFGGLALPAATIVVVAGIANALIELGRPSQLWATGYGRVLMVKIGIVGAIIAASYVHAFLLRPRLIAAASRPSPAERRHWRLLRGEPGLAALAVAAAALLAAFPLPPRQLLERAEAEQPATAKAAGIRPPSATELAVAEQAGPWMATAWVHTPVAGQVTGTVRVLNFNVRPVRAAIRIAGAHIRSCGIGCATFRVPASTASLHMTARLGGRIHAGIIPIRWDPRGTATARRILARAVAAIDRLRSQRIAERLTAGLGGPPAISRYRIDGRHNYAIVTRHSGPPETIVIGRRTWIRQPDGSWDRQVDTPEDTRQLMPWWIHRTGVRLLDLRTVRGRRIADIALADVPPPARSVPFWFRLRIDVGSQRVLTMRMIAPGHFMDQRYHAFNVPVRIRPPSMHG